MFPVILFMLFIWRESENHSVSDLINNTAMTSSDESYRLPETVKPIFYDLFLHPKLEEGTFSGKVTILIDVFEDRENIALHQKDLTITSWKLRTYGLEEDYDIKISINPPTKYDIFAIITENKTNLKPGLYQLSLEFEGNLREKIAGKVEPKLVGFYASKYKYIEDNEQTRCIATTKFEPTYARQAFPCFDEPNFKAEFSVKLVCPMENSYHSLSNMNIIKTEEDKPQENLKTTTFAKTVPMSTYLACFIISDMVSSKMMAKGLNGQEFPVSVYSTKLQTKEKRHFALHIGVKAIEYYINLFQIDYPLPKLDLVAIPDFVSGAMENWGLVTFREARLLYDDRNNSIIDKRDVIEVICHELAHMWFGNLVTLAWWNDLWLNEGFATFMSYKSANEILPNQKHMEQFSVKVMHKAFMTDAKLSSHPIIHDVQNPDQITSFFDEISYKKGASVIRMMENFIGSNVFYNAIGIYLKKYAYMNAKSADLFDILQDAVGSKLNITTIMNTWTQQEGFPVINVQRSENTYILTQKRFLQNSGTKYDPSKSAFKYRWTIPITYITNRNDTPTLIWFDKDATEVVINVDENTRWIKLNVNQVGYYRVNYEKEWETYTELLRHHPTRLSIADRANLLDDLFSLAAAGEISYFKSPVLTIIFYMLIQEYHAVPWTVASRQMRIMYNLLNSAAETRRETKKKLGKNLEEKEEVILNVATHFQIYACRIVDNIFKDVGWTFDDDMEDDVSLTGIDSTVRVTILEFACAMEKRKCLKQAGRIFNNWLTLRKMPHPNIRNLVYYYGMRYTSDEDNWRVMFEYFKKETDPLEKNKIMNGLAGIKSTDTLKKYINLAKDERIVRNQDFLNCLIAISENPDGTLLVWDWVRNNWQFLVDRYSLNDRYLGQLIPAITKSFTTETKLDEMNAFFERYPDAGAGADNRKKALETVEWNIKWIDNNACDIDDWFNNWFQKEDRSFNE
ncbi:glutamyl aminopeptidase-like isoform X2 [Nylanderia fulva]|uniref:glutamyl aminopeptidase-like isoform X2 n=1 Tax=Nylanderia fulva TaxID=613905 RepID=UPI0010FAE878|nr:glutamyl aminopeptidase-like isoform X2 [Nylanderia fulva]